MQPVPLFTVAICMVSFTVFLSSRSGQDHVTKWCPLLQQSQDKREIFPNAEGIFAASYIPCGTVQRALGHSIGVRAAQCSNNNNNNNCSIHNNRPGTVLPQ